MPDLRHRFEAATVNIKKTAIKGLLARDVAAALIWGSIFLVLGGVTFGLTTVMNPALAAVAIGGVILILIGLGAFLATKSLEKDRNRS